MQNTFAAALLNPEADVPLGLIDPQGRPVQKRFDVYRNNVASGLTRALEASFPVIRALVGEAFFGAMAVEFLRAHPPKSRLMMLYGDAFPPFLATFPPVADLAYLPDVARLEQALRESYHAADAPPLPAADLTALPEATLLQARLRLAPAVSVLQSDWPIHAIWAANSTGGPAPVMAAQSVVILRADYSPKPHLISTSAATFIAALQAGATQQMAMDYAGAAHDLTTTLALLLQGQAIVGIDI